MVYVGGAISSAFRNQRSSKGRKGYLTATPYYYPGMPEIGATEKFRSNAEKEMKKADSNLKGHVKGMELGYNTALPVKQTQKNRISATKQSKGMLRVDAYFDSGGFKDLNETISHRVRDWGNQFIQEAMSNARDSTREEVRTMHRQFKGSYFPSLSNSNDVYNKVADSLDFVVMTQDETKNQFTSVAAGSFDVDDKGEPTGVRGSRGGNLAVMTERGTGRTIMKGQPLGGTARIQERLKTR